MKKSLAAVVGVLVLSGAGCSGGDDDPATACDLLDWSELPFEATDQYPSQVDGGGARCVYAEQQTFHVVELTVYLLPSDDEAEHFVEGVWVTDQRPDMRQASRSSAVSGRFAIDLRLDAPSDAAVTEVGLMRLVVPRLDRLGSDGGSAAVVAPTATNEVPEVAPLPRVFSLAMSDDDCYTLTSPTDVAPDENCIPESLGDSPVVLLATGGNTDPEYMVFLVQQPFVFEHIEADGRALVDTFDNGVGLLQFDGAGDTPFIILRNDTETIRCSISLMGQQCAPIAA